MSVSKLDDRPFVVVFAKAPVAGTVKTRLCDVLSFEQAARLHEAFIIDLCCMLRTWKKECMQSGARWVLFYTGDVTHPVFERVLCEDQSVEFVKQVKGGLGEKLDHALAWCSAHGATSITIIGSDAPTLTPRHLEQARFYLKKADVVFGPTFDGGYYVVSCRAHHPSLFERVAWSTKRTLHDSIAQARQLGLSVKTLEFWYDVDYIEDVQFLADHLHDCLAPSGEHKYSETVMLMRRFYELGILPIA